MMTSQWNVGVNSEWQDRLKRCDDGCQIFSCELVPTKLVFRLPKTNAKAKMEHRSGGRVEILHP